ncbi:secreted RxLR effector peptide protein, putative [Phytophthora infestans T30-4]|uniref:Secreted RxLR effector peptide protein, putative n=1 Tax=Phytophthora infestans (strain T30-4) TaxID=403677 RepID=D0N8M6_PHYIT|nr:secreted RxLR effector peptide protein, putative [Phytophthora infestans T30-4]EEY53911.1 secreted RxLR effector peptide protein, putative [Phytophthora infestans T30-4]|eukprot:XP_002904542.1 secreted RxLR effector peptide protein, putative [Phytophthora infestans T30-4]
MRSLEALIITLVVLLACNSAFSIAQGLSLSTHAIRMRSLQAGITPDTEDKTKDSEERSLYKLLKVQWWISAKKSDEYVKQALKLDELDDAALKEHKNLKYFTYFQYEKRHNLLSKAFRRNLPTFEVWKKLNLDKITSRDQLKDIYQAADFRAYSRYVKMFDNSVVGLVNGGVGTVPRVMIARGATDPEITARTILMAREGRSDNVAKVLLGLTEADDPFRVLSGAKLIQHQDYKYFELF